MAASTFNNVVDEQAVYLTAGAVLPSVVEEIMHSLLNDDFETAYKAILQVSYRIYYIICSLCVFIASNCTCVIASE